MTRNNRGSGCVLKFNSKTKLPNNWFNFLRENKNKSRLFEFLSQGLLDLNIPEGKQIIATLEENVVCVPERNNVSNISPCTHEEADTRIMVHVLDAVSHGLTKVQIRTVDTDIIVLAISLASQLLSLDECWVAFGTGKDFKYIAVHEIANCLGPDTCKALPMFHAFTGCDTVSSFNGKGKKTAWDVWKSFPEVTSTFTKLTDFNPQKDDVSDHMGNLQRYVVLLYDKVSGLETVNECRKYLFTRKSKNMENMPPTEAALHQHCLRSILQGGLIWGQATNPRPIVPDYASFGWVKGLTRFEPMWTTLEQAANVCDELVKCGCKVGCTGKCKCTKLNLKCTALCLCGGNCKSEN